MSKHKSETISKLLTFFIFNPCIYLAYNYRVEGRENIPEAGPYVLAMKHQSWIDIPISCNFAKNQPTYLGKRELLENVLGDFQDEIPFLVSVGKIITPLTSWVLRRIGMIPIDRDHPTKTIESFKVIKEKMAEGDCIAFYPEGKIVKDTIGEFKPGFIKMAVRLQKEKSISIPFIPIGISYEKKKLFRKKVVVKIGKPIIFEWNDRKAHERLREEVEKLTDFNL